MKGNAKITLADYYGAGQRAKMVVGKTAGNRIAGNQNWKVKFASGRAVRRALLALGVAAAAATISGCLSVHVHKDVDQPAPVVVVPSDHTNP
jgi:hypothetical protein